MTIQEFGNAFKKAIKDSGKGELQLAIYEPRNSAVELERFLGRSYAYPNFTINNLGLLADALPVSSIIDGFYEKLGNHQIAAGALVGNGLIPMPVAAAGVLIPATGLRLAGAVSGQKALEGNTCAGVSTNGAAVMDN